MLLYRNVDGYGLVIRQVAAYDPTTNKAYAMSWGDGKLLISIDVGLMRPGLSEEMPNKFIQTMFVDSDGPVCGITFDEKQQDEQKSTGRWKR